MVRNPQDIAKELDEALALVDALRHELRVAEHPIVSGVYSYLAEFDDNWRRLCLAWGDGKLEVWLNGPKLGDVVLDELVARLIPKLLIQRLLGEKKLGTVERFVNPAHRVELVPWRLVLDFENTDTGVIGDVNGDTCRVHCRHGTTDEITREEIETDLALDMPEFRCEVERIHYLPFRDPENGKRFETHKDVIGR